jgi:hypothetical protein
MSSTLKDFINDYPAPIVQEMMRIFPDGVVITSGIYALITLSFPFAVMFGSLVEATLIFHVLRSVSSFLDIVPSSLEKSAYKHICRTGFSDPVESSMGSLSLFTSILEDSSLLNQFPSSSIYMLSVASSYLFSTLNAQSKELEALGPNFSSRYYISMIFLSLLLFTFVCFRLAYSCETFGTVILSVPIGLIIGYLLVLQNQRLFGKSSINLLGIPQLKSVSSSGQKINVCLK